MRFGRRSLLKGFAALIAAPYLPPLPPSPTGFAAWSANPLLKFATWSGPPPVLFLNRTDYSAILKALYPQERIDALVYDDTPFLKMIPKQSLFNISAEPSVFLK